MQRRPREASCYCPTSTRTRSAATHATSSSRGRAAARALAPSGQAGNYPVLLIDGLVAGVWHQRRSGRRIAVTVEPLTRLTAGQRQTLETQVARIGEILEGEARLTVGTVTAGGHA